MKTAIWMFAAGAALWSIGATAQQAQHMSHDHMSMRMDDSADARRLLDFPPPMRAHMLANMRGHLEAVSEIVAALAQSDGARAGEIAAARLGMDSPGAAGCNPKSPHATEGMGAMMAQHMPPDMRALGLSMHEAASAFATEATKLKKGGDPQPALAALAHVTEACAACHSAFRVR